MPSFGWKLESDRRNVLQSAYRIVVKTEDTPVWDSGRVESRDSVAVPWAGPGRLPNTAYQVHLTVWDDGGERAEADTSFETGKLTPANFTARWITHALPESETACPVFTTRFVGKKPVRARLYASACGIYDAAINGKPVSRDWFSPGWTSYAKRIQYQTWDVTGLIEENNTLELTVAPGWYAGYLNGEGRNHFYGDRTAVFAELHLWYADGRKRAISSGTDWTVTTGPVRYAEFYHGETVDSTAVPGTPMPAILFDGMDTARLVSQQNEPVRVVRTLAPQAILHTPAGETVLDFGQNLAGVVELTVEGTPGQKIVLRHGEVLDREGNLYTDNLRTARAVDTFLCRGGKETFRPRFTYHGFRYVAVAGLENADLSGIRACVLRMAFLREKTLRELIPMSPPGAEAMYQGILDRLNQMPEPDTV